MTQKIKDLNYIFHYKDSASLIKLLLKRKSNHKKSFFRKKILKLTQLCRDEQQSKRDADDLSHFTDVGTQKTESIDLAAVGSRFILPSTSYLALKLSRLRTINNWKLVNVVCECVLCLI